MMSVDHFFTVSRQVKLKSTVVIISFLLILIFTVQQTERLGTTNSDAVTRNKQKSETFVIPFNTTDSKVIDHTPKVHEFSNALIKNNSALGQNGVNIFILAAMRTGSTFIGELFGQREDVFYLYEPGQALFFYFKARRLSGNFLVPSYLKLLHKIFKCDFSSSKILVDALSRRIEEGRIYKFAPALLTSNLSEGKEAPSSTSFLVSEITKICKRLPHKAVKSIRIHDINLMTHLMEQGNGNLKVIHLIRDPRGMVASRLLLDKRISKDQLFNATHLTETRAYLVPGSSWFTKRRPRRGVEGETETGSRVIQHCITRMK
ncbi:Carbohydrate sulfotransferase 1 [Holothuria leucospilota]|uniref:Carbohydrate sulfotransferase 1 n=1 Tax=Holothuria leucospilota TaxID=206669 RepID=A0A9Q1HFI3_HOLLE|nr:Carbohydrate sulfotransferase 1 [Holothuria leucospilota]